MYTHTENLPRTNTVPLYLGWMAKPAVRTLPAPRDTTFRCIWASPAEHLHSPGARHIHAAAVTMGPKDCCSPRAHSLLDEAHGPAWLEDVRGRHSARLSEREGQTGTP